MINRGLSKISPIPLATTSKKRFKSIDYFIGPICTPAFPTSFNFETSVDAMADFIPSVKTGPVPSASSSDLLLSSVNSPDAYDMIRGKLHKSANATVARLHAVLVGTRSIGYCCLYNFTFFVLPSLSL